MVLINVATIVLASAPKELCLDQRGVLANSPTASGYNYAGNWSQVTNEACE
jgi:hypothetical protein